MVGFCIHSCYYNLSTFSVVSGYLFVLLNCLCLSLPPEKAQANEQRYTKLKEKYTGLVQSHAELLRKVGVFFFVHTFAIIHVPINSLSSLKLFQTLKLP